MLHLKAPSTKPLPLGNHPFWEFSCDIYKDTKDILLEMQSHHGLNVNAILFCYWFSANYQKVLSKNDIKRVLTTIHKWHQHIIRPLRTLRDSLSKYTYRDSLNAIRQEVLASELMAEKIEQSLMVDLFAKEKCHIKNPSMYQAASCAFRSIKFYCDVLYITLNDQDCDDFIQITHKIFPNMKKENITALGYKILRYSTNPTNKPANLELFK
ncbi:MAG: putative cytosolic protein [Gammaproteobacteria bacterium]|jgi:uncharacterized protein (TIGR02444 family)|nr:putative cytosolic protein [Gammaproteobacteria bacterium]